LSSKTKIKKKKIYFKEIQKNNNNNEKRMPERPKIARNWLRRLKKIQILKSDSIFFYG
jgi:fibrillarin-like rRNA methylase